MRRAAERQRMDALAGGAKQDAQPRERGHGSEHCVGAAREGLSASDKEIEPCLRDLVKFPG
jgi:hypothetical protein